MVKLFRKLFRAFLNYDPSFCDMYEDQHARMAGAEYLKRIKTHLRERFGSQRLSMLDAGCQAGRLLIPLAQAGHTMIGIDTSPFAMHRLRRHAKADRLALRLIRGDLTHLPRWIQPASLDAVICIEVLYLCQNYRTLLQQFVDVVKPGGLVFVAHRPTLYYVARALLNGTPGQAEDFLDRSEGPSTDGTYHNWQTQEQLAVLYRSLGLQIIGCHPIDQHVVQLDLAEASARVRQFLNTTILHDLAHIPTYLLIAAQKPHE